MRENNHERAQKLIASARGNGMEPADQAWLESHVRHCVACAQYSEQLEGVVRALRSVSVMPSPGLVSTTQLRVRARAMELSARDAMMRPLWIACSVAVLLSAVTTPYLWMGFSWAARSLGVPALVWQTGFLMAWALPAILVTALVIARRTHAEGSDEVDLRS